MTPFLIGVETEYAVHGTRRSGEPAERHLVLTRLVEAATAGLPWLPDGRSAGVFLPNGGRLYVDCGLHPEFATPECADPWEVLRQVRAGERLLAEAAGRIPAREPGIGRVDLFRCNVDYWNGEATWGFHESYLHRADPVLLPRHLIPHLVSRLIYAGAGGFDPTSPGLEFVLSPRACLTTEVSSGSSAHGRPLFHLKDEPLAGPGFHRLHVILADTPCSDVGLVLRLGATALVLKAIELGARPGDEVALADPLGALRTVLRDPTCREPLRLEDGRWMSALEIQRLYLGAARRLRERRPLPPWTERVCRLWEETLDALESDPDSLIPVLDWPLKQALYRGWVERAAATRSSKPAGSCPSWSELASWGRAARWIGGALLGRRGSGPGPGEDLSESVPAGRSFEELLGWLRERELGGSRLGCFVELRAQLLEADYRFGQLGERGIHEALVREGVVHDRLVAEAELLRAIQEPPAGRGRLRGRWVRLLGTGARRHVADWTAIRESPGERWLDLSDPFGVGARWRGPSGCPGAAAHSSTPSEADRWREADEALFE